MVSGLGGLAQAALGGGAAGGVISIIIRAQDQYSNEMQKAAASTDRLKNSALASAAKMTVLGAAIGITVKFLGDAAQAGLKFETAQAKFNATTTNSSKLLKDLQDASKGTVSNLDLMTNSNQALALGIDQNKLPELLKISGALGQQTGRSVTEAFGDITRGIGRQSPLILDNLGIIIDSNAAYDTYAKKIGKSASELTVAEQKTAFLNAVIEQGNKKYAESGGLIETTEVKLARLTTSYDNFKQKVGTGLINVGTKLLDWFSGLGEKIKPMTDKMLPELKSAWSGLFSEFGGGNKILSTLSDIIGKYIIISIKIMLTLLTGLALVVRENILGFKIIADTIYVFGLRLKEAGLHAKIFWNTLTGQDTTLLNAQLTDTSLKISEVTNRLATNKQEFVDTGEKIKQLGPNLIQNIKKPMEESAESAKKSGKVLIETAGEVTNAWGQAATSINDFQAAVDNLNKQKAMASGIIGGTSVAREEFTRTIEQAKAYGSTITSFTRGNIQNTAEGGIVMSPQIRRIGEAGPEAIIPLNKTNSMGGITINIGTITTASARQFADDLMGILNTRLQATGRIR